jgi:hypothetical protein
MRCCVSKMRSLFSDSLDYSCDLSGFLPKTTSDRLNIRTCPGTIRMPKIICRDVCTPIGMDLSPKNHNIPDKPEKNISIPAKKLRFGYIFMKGINCFSWAIQYTPTKKPTVNPIHAPASTHRAINTNHPSKMTIAKDTTTNAHFQNNCLLTISSLSL